MMENCYERNRKNHRVQIEYTTYMYTYMYITWNAYRRWKPLKIHRPLEYLWTLATMLGFKTPNPNDVPKERRGGGRLLPYSKKFNIIEIWEWAG